jgi:hypothetical protein
MKVSVSKKSSWDIHTFAKAPLELLLCEDLHPNSKLLWIVLANQVRFGPIDKSVLDKMIGIHRSTRIRCIKELKEYGLIEGTEDKIVLVDPIPVLRRMIDVSYNARAEIKNLLDKANAEQETDIRTDKSSKQELKPKENDYFQQATDAWNSFRPANYSKINRLSSQLLRSIDAHIMALKLKPHAYADFFSVLKNGIEHSTFWSKDNSSKTLQSIVGIGSPQSKKYQNVYTLYNDGLNYDKAEAVLEQDRKDELVLKAKHRRLIDDYDELHMMYCNLLRDDPDNIDILTPRILKIEQAFREEGLDPARFRLMFRLPSWPSDVPEPREPREQFWRYDDEK